ncbi:MAG: ATP-binding protein, partial [candidate division WOR-3 bacterium]
MISKETIKEIIKSNEQFINNQISKILPRQGLPITTRLKKVNVIYGVRRSGKTFVLYELFKQNKGRALYIDFEDERLNGIAISELDKIRESFFELYPHLLYKKDVIFLFDEIQNVLEWERYARRLVEREAITLYVAGSSSKINPQNISSSLRGREWAVPLFPFSFREFLMAQGIVLDKSILYGKEKMMLSRYLLEYLKYGGFPEVVFAKSDFDKQKILYQYLNAMFFKDLVEQFNINNLNLLEALRENLFANFSSKFSGLAFYKQFKGRFPLS